MKTPITACLLALTLAACSTTPPNQQTTPNGQVPLARIYIKSMTTQMPELAINDVVLAEIWEGERLSIWLKPGTSYTFSVKPMRSLNTNYTIPPATLTLDLKAPSVYKVRIGFDKKGLTLQSQN